MSFAGTHVRRHLRGLLTHLQPAHPPPLVAAELEAVTAAAAFAAVDAKGEDRARAAHRREILGRRLR